MDAWDNLAKKHVYKALQKKRIQNVFLNEYAKHEAWQIIHFSTKDTASETEIRIQVRGLDWIHSQEKYVDAHMGDTTWDVLCVVILNYSIKEPCLVYVIPRKRITQSEGMYKLCGDHGNVICTKGGRVRLHDIPSAREYFDLQFRNRWEYVDTTGKYYTPET